MSYKEFLYDSDSRKAMISGVEKVAKAVKKTLGPRGRNVVFDKPNGYPVITNDGVTIAQQIILKDKFEQIGALLVQQASSKTNDIAGDGTTSVVILVESILKEANKMIESGANPMLVKRGLQSVSREIVKYIKENLSREIESVDEVRQIATISSNNDEIIGKLISEAIDKVGTDGVITVEESKTIDTDIEVVQGMQFARGYIAPQFATDSNLKAELDNPYILLTDEVISSPNIILPIIDEVAKNNASILIVADNVEGEALSTLIVNKMRGLLKVCAVKAPAFGDRRKAELEDIAIATGSILISEKFGTSLSETKLGNLGRARKVIVTKNDTTIIDGNGDENSIDERVEVIRNEMDEVKYDYDREKLNERLAKLIGGVAVLRVGAATETELKEKKMRIEDALAATRAAVSEGFVAGGSTAYIRSSIAVREKLRNSEEYKRVWEMSIAPDIMVKSLSEPLRVLANNSGNSYDIILEKIMSSEDFSIGFDALTNEMCNLIEHGVIDPTLVITSAIENAVSIASMILTTETSIVEVMDDTNQ